METPGGCQLLHYLSLNYTGDKTLSYFGKQLPDFITANHSVNSSIAVIPE
jgi:hypothetical protein